MCVCVCACVCALIPRFLGSIRTYINGPMFIFSYYKVFTENVFSLSVLHSTRHLKAAAPPGGRITPRAPHLHRGRYRGAVSPSSGLSSSARCL